MVMTMVNDEYDETMILIMMRNVLVLVTALTRNPFQQSANHDYHGNIDVYQKDAASD